ncbi:MAG TPA: chemotaxis protein CheA, partial [Anaeromyxobacter sp.]
AAIAPPPPAAEEPPPPFLTPEPASAWHVAGAHRVVVHTLEGQVKRGVLEDVDLDAGSLGLAPLPGAAPEAVPSDKVKAIFFMLAPGEKAPPPEGKKVRVTFRDGRQVAGFSPDYRDEGVGFFMIPVDTRTNTGRIWVYRSAVRQVSVS